MPRKIPHRPAAPAPIIPVSSMANMCRAEPVGTVLASASVFVTFVKVDGGVEARFCDGQVKFMAESAWS